MINELVEGVVSAGAAPGAAIALKVGGRQTFAAAGSAHATQTTPLTLDSRFQLGCITKVLTSLLALELAEEGRLDLDCPIGTFIDELRDTFVGRSVCCRHLLSHTSGYRGVNIADPTVRYYFSWRKFVELLTPGSQLFAPGTVFNYEHTECVLLGEIIERIARCDITTLFRTVIMEPLGIATGRVGGDHEAASSQVPDHALDPSSNRYRPLRAPPSSKFWRASLSDLTMSVGDLLRLGEAIAGLDFHTPFSRNSIEALQRAQIALPASIGPAQHERIPGAFGHGLAHYDGGLLGHNGSARGQTCALRIAGASNAVMVVAMNAWRPYARDLLVRKIFAADADDRSAACVIGNLPDWVGRYLGAFDSLVDVSCDGSNLSCFVRSGGSQPQELRIDVSCAPSGPIEVRSAASHVTVAFFEEPRSHARNLMVGLNAYAGSR